MATFKIEIKGNYFYMSIDNSAVFKRAASKIEIVKTLENDQTYDIMYQGKNTNYNNLNWSDFVDSNDSPFANQTNFDNWIDQNTGFNTAGQTTALKTGFIDYNDTTGPISLIANTWTDVPNNGLGAFSNSLYKPDNVNDVLDTSTGYLDFSELTLGSELIIRNDFKVNPSTNNALLEVRYLLGQGAGEYPLLFWSERLDNGSGIDYQRVLIFAIYMGDTNTQGGVGKLQIKLSTNGTLTNAGSYISIKLR
jgi:hypothetical protein